MVFSEVKPLKEKHLKDAAKLFSNRYIIEKEYIPFIPPRYEDYNTVLPLLSDLVQKAPGVVVMKGGKLCGYLIGRLLPSWRGRRSVLVPVWAHSAADDGDRKEVVRQMYSRISSKWVANGCFTHLITILAHDKEIIDTLFWFGFGMAVVDAMRDLSIVRGPTADVDIHRADLADLEVVLSLSNELQRYMARSPIFMAMEAERGEEYFRKWLSNPSNALWLALEEGEAVSFLRICPLNEDYLVTDEKTAWIQGAFTKEYKRGSGFGTTLLKQAIDWAKSRGFERCAVDFEGENVLGSTFWLRHFQSICFSLIRQVDKRISRVYQERGS